MLTQLSAYWSMGPAGARSSACAERQQRVAHADGRASIGPEPNWHVQNGEEGREKLTNVCIWEMEQRCTEEEGVGAPNSAERDGDPMGNGLGDLPPCFLGLRLG